LFPPCVPPGVWEMLPVAVVLGGSGIGELFRKYHYVTRRRRGDGEHRPRVQVSGPKVQQTSCQICLGRIKEGTEYIRCSSGRAFHAACLDRVGGCPYCQRTVEIKGKEGQPRAPPVPAAPLGTSVPILPPDDGSFLCPVCGVVLEQGAHHCLSCGAIFVDPNGMFVCPDCHAELREGDLTCGRCGRTFERVEMPRCPQCDIEVSPNAEVCPRCSCLLQDRCPECGEELSEDALTCPACGTDFEFL
jgi:hypothetical protein